MAAYDPAANTFFVPSSNQCARWSAAECAQFCADHFYLGSEPTLIGPSSGWFNAIDVSTGIFNWRNHLDLPANGGALVKSYQPRQQSEPTRPSSLSACLTDDSALMTPSRATCFGNTTPARLSGRPRQPSPKTAIDTCSWRRGAGLYQGAGAERDHWSERADNVRFENAKYRLSDSGRYRSTKLSTMLARSNRLEINDRCAGR